MSYGKVESRHDRGAFPIVVAAGDGAWSVFGP